MEKYIAVVKYENNKITKYQSFAEKSKADSHILTYGGFVAEKPDSGSLEDQLKYWIVDTDKKTLTYDSDTQESDNVTAAWALLRSLRNEKLAESDWMANSDVTMSADWKRYREELRQLPASYNDTTVQGTITWPDEPVE